MADKIFSLPNINPQQALNLKRKIDPNADLKKAAAEFESIFISQMLKQARTAKLSEGLFGSNAEDTFNAMLDQEYSQILSKRHNFGIAESLVRQLSPKHKNISQFPNTLKGHK